VLAELYTAQAQHCYLSMQFTAATLLVRHRECHLAISTIPHCRE